MDPLENIETPIEAARGMGWTDGWVGATHRPIRDFETVEEARSYSTEYERGRQERAVANAEYEVEHPVTHRPPAPRSCGCIACRVVGWFSARWAR